MRGRRDEGTEGWGWGWKDGKKRVSLSYIEVGVIFFYFHSTSTTPVFVKLLFSGCACLVPIFLQYGFVGGW